MADELDRLFHRLVDVLRDRQGPRPLGSFTVGEVFRELVPYARVRTPLGFWSHGDYEFTLLRLLAGERGYLLSDTEAVREACTRELAAPVPDTSLYREFEEARIRVNPRVLPRADAEGA
jgi:hypothetical protein